MEHRRSSYIPCCRETVDEFLCTSRAPVGSCHSSYDSSLPSVAILSVQVYTKFEAFKHKFFAHFWLIQDYILYYGSPLKVVDSLFAKLRINVVSSEPLNHRNIGRIVSIRLKQNMLDDKLQFILYMLGGWVTYIVVILKSERLVAILVVHFTESLQDGSVGRNDSDELHEPKKSTWFEHVTVS